MDSKRFKILMLAKDVLVGLIFVVSIWLLVTSVKNEKEPYRILSESDQVFQRTKKLDSLINVRIELGDSERGYFCLGLTGRFGSRLVKTQKRPHVVPSKLDWIPDEVDLHWKGIIGSEASQMPDSLHSILTSTITFF